MNKMKQHKKIVMQFIALIFIASGSIIIFNCVVDPLWYLQGNRLAPINYSFNERLSKLNRYYYNRNNYDCIVIGSSVTTMLDASKIQNYRCYNFSFSAGNIKEFKAYLRYTKAIGADLSLVIVGVDYFNFMKLPLDVNVPDAVLKNMAPDNILAAYLSYDAFKLSLKSVLSYSPRPRNYDHKFKGVFINPTSYRPLDALKRNNDRRQFYYRAEPLFNDSVSLYKELRDIFPDANYIGYVPPKSAWDSSKMYLKGYLPNALDVMHEVSGVFDKFYDFSMPTKITIPLNDTYDGFHFGRETNDHVVDAINSGNKKYMYSVNQLSLEDYKYQYTFTVKNFVATHKLKLKD